MAPESRADQRVCKRSWVSGRVQGVFYRASTAQKARSLGLDGYARNLPDGRVEVVACGGSAAVDELLKWLWTGSSASKVTAVDTESFGVDQVRAGTGFLTG